MELVLKERLSRIHPALIFKNIDAAVMKTHVRGEAGVRTHREECSIPTRVEQVLKLMADSFMQA